MKKSKYNYIINNGDSIFCFNALTRMFFKIANKNKEILNNVLISPDFFKARLPLFYQKLSNGGFIIDDDVDELNEIRKLNVEACNTKNYMLTILPTIDCNFRCWYCYEQHEKSEMSSLTIEKIKNI